MTPVNEHMADLQASPPGEHHGSRIYLPLPKSELRTPSALLRRLRYALIRLLAGRDAVVLNVEIAGVVTVLGGANLLAAHCTFRTEATPQ